VLALTELTDVAEIEVNDVGWTSRVYLVGHGRFVVKFPRHEDVRREYEQERSILTALENVRLDAQIPRIRWTDVDNSYLGYEGIVGQTFDRACAATDAATRARVGQTVGNFLAQLHALQLGCARTISVDDEITEYQYKYRLGLPAIDGNVTRAERARLQALVHEVMPSELQRLGGDLVLCHGDLGYWNLVLSADGTVGVIDFGDVGYFDRSKDFIGLTDTDIMEAALATYGDTELLREKIAIRQRVLPILDLPFHLGKGDAQGIARTMERIRAAAL